MIEEGLFSRFLKPLLQKKNEKDLILSVLNKSFQKKLDIEIRNQNIIIKKVSPIQKRELFLQKELIENDIEIALSKKYTISF